MDSVIALRKTGLEKGLSDERINFLERIMGSESSGDNAAKNPNSTAVGLFQFIEETWNRLVSKHPDELTKDGRKDPKQQRIAAIYFTQDNEEILTKALGRKPDDGELYLAHFLGTGGKNGEKGAIDIIREAEKNSSKPIKGFLPDIVLDKNKDVYLPLENGKKLFIKDFSVADLHNWSAGKMGIPAKYETGINVRKDKNGIFDSQGNLVMVAIAVAVAVVAFVASGIGDIFSGDDPKPGSIPSKPRGHSRA